MRTLSLAILGLIACGPPKPGPQANVTYFWKVSSSTVDFGSMCSDEPKFRSDNGPLAFQQNSYVVYKGSADAKKATLMTCTAVDPATCTPAMSGIVFDVAGAELSYSDEIKSPTGAGMCNVLDTRNWLLTDMVKTMTLQIADTLSLVDDQTTCDQIEASAKMRSTNGQGFQGCTITFTIGGTAGQ